jgi:hypothetical protein
MSADVPCSRVSGDQCLHGAHQSFKGHEPAGVVALLRVAEQFLQVFIAAIRLAEEGDRIRNVQ